MEGGGAGSSRVHDMGSMYIYACINPKWVRIFFVLKDSYAVLVHISYLYIIFVIYVLLHMPIATRIWVW